MPLPDAEPTPGETPEVSVRYWASARAAAGVAVDVVPVSSATRLDVLLDVVRDRHRDRPRFADTLAVCSVLVDDRPVGSSDRSDVVVRPGQSVELLPPFAGG